MCGIVGVLGKSPVAMQVVDALKRLEYRGYDSAGVATLEHGRLERRRAEGKLRNLELKLSQAPLSGAVGIGHTRWATHGKPNETNAHPHATDRLAVVHNGIIENFRELKAELQAEGVAFETETDTEVVAHLVSQALRDGRSPVDAVAVTLRRLRGAFALVFLFTGEDDLLIGARHGAPLAIGYGDGEMYLGSDALALAPLTDSVTYLEDGDWVVLAGAGARHPQRGRRAGRAAPAEGPGRRLHGREGQLPPLHGQGDSRAARGRRPHARPLRPLRGRTGLPALHAAVRLRRAAPRVGLGLRHRLLRRADRQILVRALGAPARRDRRRLGVPLPRSAAGAGRPRAIRLPVGRDGRHARLAALRQAGGAARPLHRQRADLDDCARERGRRADAGGARNRRRLDQSLHMPAYSLAVPRDFGGARARRAVGERRKGSRRGPNACPQLDDQGSEA